MGRAGGTGSQAATLSVLVVDDEPEMADLVATYLERVVDAREANVAFVHKRMRRERYQRIASHVRRRSRR